MSENKKRSWIFRRRSTSINSKSVRQSMEGINTPQQLQGGEDDNKSTVKRKYGGLRVSKLSESRELGEGLPLTQKNEYDSNPMQKIDDLLAIIAKRSRSPKKSNKKLAKNETEPTTQDNQTNRRKSLFMRKTIVKNKSQQKFSEPKKSIKNLGIKSTLKRESSTSNVEMKQFQATSSNKESSQSIPASQPENQNPKNNGSRQGESTPSKKYKNATNLLFSKEKIKKGDRNQKQIEQRGNGEGKAVKREVLKDRKFDNFRLKIPENEENENLEIKYPFKIDLSQEIESPSPSKSYLSSVDQVQEIQEDNRISIATTDLLEDPLQDSYSMKASYFSPKKESKLKDLEKMQDLLQNVIDLIQESEHSDSLISLATQILKGNGIKLCICDIDLPQILQKSSKNEKFTKKKQEDSYYDLNSSQFQTDKAYQYKEDYVQAQNQDSHYHLNKLNSHLSTNLEAIVETEEDYSSCQDSYKTNKYNSQNDYMSSKNEERDNEGVDDRLLEKGHQKNIKNEEKKFENLKKSIMEIEDNVEGEDSILEDLEDEVFKNIDIKLISSQNSDRIYFKDSISQKENFEDEKYQESEIQTDKFFENSFNLDLNLTQTTCSTIMSGSQNAKDLVAFGAANKKSTKKINLKNIENEVVLFKENNSTYRNISSARIHQNKIKNLKSLFKRSNNSNNSKNQSLKNSSHSTCILDKENFNTYQKGNIDIREGSSRLGSRQDIFEKELSIPKSLQKIDDFTKTLEPKKSKKMKPLSTMELDFDSGRGMDTLKDSYNDKKDSLRSLEQKQKYFKKSKNFKEKKVEEFVKETRSNPKNRINQIQEDTIKDPCLEKLRKQLENTTTDVQNSCSSNPNSNHKYDSDPFNDSLDTDLEPFHMRTSKYSYVERSPIQPEQLSATKLMSTGQLRNLNCSPTHLLFFKQQNKLTTSLTIQGYLPLPQSTLIVEVQCNEYPSQLVNYLFSSFLWKK